MDKENLIIRKSFIASHNNGFIWALNPDALYEFTEIAIKKFLDDMKSVKRPSTPSALAINLNETLVHRQFAEMMAESLSSAGLSVRKVAFVGLDNEGLRNLKQDKDAQRRICLSVF